jgi:hypothetical protein
MENVNLDTSGLLIPYYSNKVMDRSKVPKLSFNINSKLSSLVKKMIKSYNDNNVLQFLEDLSSIQKLVSCDNAFGQYLQCVFNPVRYVKLIPMPFRIKVSLINYSITYNLTPINGCLFFLFRPFYFINNSGAYHTIYNYTCTGVTADTTSANYVCNSTMPLSSYYTSVCLTSCLLTAKSYASELNEQGRIYVANTSDCKSSVSTDPSPYTVPGAYVMQEYSSVNPVKKGAYVCHIPISAPAFMSTTTSTFEKEAGLVMLATGLGNTQLTFTITFIGMGRATQSTYPFVGYVYPPSGLSYTNYDIGTIVEDNPQLITSDLEYFESNERAELLRTKINQVTNSSRDPFSIDLENASDLSDSYSKVLNRLRNAPDN